MSAMKISIRPLASHEPIILALARFILTASVLVVLFAGLFPFDFHVPPRGAWQEIRHTFDSSPEPPLLQDRLQNILFFVPFGFGLSASIRRRRGQAAVRVMAAGVLGAGLSLTVEVLQVFLGFRDPTWSDVVMNTTGSVLGAVVVIFAGDQILEECARLLARLRPYATLRNVTIVLVAYVLLQFALPFRAQNRGLLDNWDSGFPLLVGNETVGDRGWEGRMWQLDLADRSASAAEARQIFEQGHARQVFGDALVGSYATVGHGPFEDATGLLKPLAWVGNDPRNPPATGPATDAAATASQPAAVSNQRWLRTTAAVAPATHRIRQSSQFTLAVTIAPDEAFQTGPARIVSISGGVYRRNLSLMQHHHDLSVRVRTPLRGDDGSAPEALIDNVFDTTEPRQVTISYRDPLMIVYVDGAERGRMEITPEAEFIWRMYPRTGWKVRLDRYGFRSYALVYRLLVFIPFAALLAAATALSGRSWKTQFVMIAGAIVAVALILEVILGQLTTSGFQPRNLSMSIAIAAVAVAVMRVRPGESRPAGAGTYL
jgi:glycopeptide antibiotics resistance protein